MSSRGGVDAALTTTYKLETAGAEIAYDVHGTVPAAGRPSLVMLAEPMDAGGFAPGRACFAASVRASRRVKLSRRLNGPCG